MANIYALLFDQETKTEDIKEDDLVISYLQGEATDTTNEVWAKSKMTRSIALAQKEEAKKPKQKVEDLVPKALHEYLSVFSRGIQTEIVTNLSSVTSRRSRARKVY